MCSTPEPINHVVDAGADQRGAEVDGGLGRSALAVERRRGGLDREALLQPGVAGDVLACSPICWAQPAITSSTSAASTPERSISSV